jgi:nucleoid-associated protein YgaU
MIALRKDVKVGFTIGGVALGVFGVYLGLSALAGPKPDTSMTGANLQLTPFGGSPSPTSIADVGARQTPLANAPRESAGSTSNGPTLANPPQPLTTAGSGNPDIWDNAFQTGKLQQPAVTVTPDASKLPPSSPIEAPKPSDVISAINNPPSDTNHSSSPAKPSAGTGTASAADPSGSLAMGTSSALTRNAAPNSSPSTQPSGQSHMIEIGETFSSIAASFYGDAKYYKLIVDANPQIDANKLKPGMVIKIPTLEKREPRSDTVDVPSMSTIDPSRQYVVKTGDSLSRIATSLYGDQNMWQKIYDLNKPKIGDSPARLKLGMVLDLPAPPDQKQ